MRSCFFFFCWFFDSQPFFSYFFFGFWFFVFCFCIVQHLTIQRCQCLKTNSISNRAIEKHDDKETWFLSWFNSSIVASISSARINICWVRNDSEIVERGSWREYVLICAGEQGGGGGGVLRAAFLYPFNFFFYFITFVEITH